MATPFVIEHLGRVGSTQDEARIRYRRGPLLVTASGQDAGRGRSGHEWIEADRGMAASLAFELDWPGEAMARITLVAGLAATDVLPDSIGLKWPNDVMVGDQKIGGIISESADGLVVVGFGMNVFWKSPPVGMGAVHASDPGEKYSRVTAERWAEALLDRIGAGVGNWGREQYLARCTTIGRVIEWEPGGSGLAVGVADDGALLVESGSKVIPLYAGAIRDIRPS